MGPVLTHAPTPVAMAATLSTTVPLELRSGCLLLSGSVIVFPSDAQWDEERRAVVFPQDHERPTVPVGSNLPPGFGGGLMPIEFARRLLDPATESKVRACLDLVHQTDVLIVNCGLPLVAWRHRL
jgi:hypothetical protein